VAVNVEVFCAHDTTPPAAGSGTAAVLTPTPVTPTVVLMTVAEPSAVSRQPTPPTRRACSCGRPSTRTPCATVLHLRQSEGNEHRRDYPATSAGRVSSGQLGSPRLSNAKRRSSACRRCFVEEVACSY
jgi:hypothetical protein